MKSSWVSNSKEMHNLFALYFGKFAFSKTWEATASVVHESVEFAVLSPTLRSIRELFEDEMVEVYNTQPWRSRIFVHERRGE